MNELQVGFRVALPPGTKIKCAEEFYISMYYQGDTYAQRLVLDIEGCDVQIVRYDGDDAQTIVFIGSRAKEMSMSEVGDYIRENV